MSDHIAHAGNTIVPAYLVLMAKGYEVQCFNLGGAPPDEWWRASDPLGEFTADDLVTLLGLVCLRETRGPDWKASDAEIEHFLRLFPS